MTDEEQRDEKLREVLVETALAADAIVPAEYGLVILIVHRTPVDTLVKMGAKRMSDQQMIDTLRYQADAIEAEREGS